MVRRKPRGAVIADAAPTLMLAPVLSSMLEAKIPDFEFSCFELPPVGVLPARPRTVD